MSHDLWKRPEDKSALATRTRIKQGADGYATNDLGEVVGPRESALIVNVDDGTMSMLLADLGGEREMLPIEALLGAILILARDEDWIESTLELAGLEKKN
jgi:hypothetical protein